MGNNVFANGREVSCKAADGKSICAFPDVCFTPPENPATPPGVPIPYPNTAFAKDTSSGSKNVKVSDKEVMLKNKSFFKTSTGDEAGCAAKKNVVTSKIKGKAYFIAWSMDVKFEGENVVRHMDMTTHNHGSLPAGAPPTIHVDRMVLINDVDCGPEKIAIKEACGEPGTAEWEKNTECPSAEFVDEAKALRNQYVTDTPEAKIANLVVDKAFDEYALSIQKDPCHNALRCALVTYSRGKNGGCCPPQTPEHLIPASQFGKDRGKDYHKQGLGFPKYIADQAPCMCAEGGAQKATHGLLGGGRRKIMDDKGVTPGVDSWTVADSSACGSESAERVEKQCSKECIDAQIKKGHENMNITEDMPIGTKQSVDDANLAEFRKKYGEFEPD
jgi:hypothetical protein